MGKKKVIWSAQSSFDMLEIMQYYTKRNKSKIYSSKLYKEIQSKLQSLEFSVSYPQKTSDTKLFYFTHNHIFIGFDILGENLKVQLVIDERRNPQLINKLLKDLD
jgi:hypothetical protein